MHLLVTGGAGYIGSHTILQLLEKGYKVTVIDNLSNGKIKALSQVAKLAGKMPHFIHSDLRNQKDLFDIFSNNSFDGVIHFAGLKSVSESTDNPLLYYNNNIVSTLNLLNAMRKTGVNLLVFSSSATVYGLPIKLPIDETAARSTSNPYGHTKLIIEDILGNIFESDPAMKIINLRYFNPVGAHHSGDIGEDPIGTPNNLMPLLSQVAYGRRDSLLIYGNDYDTIDGTGVRDYIHVDDLARGHLYAIDYLSNSASGLFESINLGTGSGISVLQMIAAYEVISHMKIKYHIVGRRKGDIASCYADVTKASKILNWQSTFGLTEMCSDSWRWQVQNPFGYI